MKLTNLTIEEILARSKKKGSKIYCIGAGRAFRTFEQSFQMLGIDDFIFSIADNSPALWNSSLTAADGREIEIMSIPELLKRIVPEDIVIVTTQYISEVMDQIGAVPQENDVAFYGFLIDHYCDTMLRNGEMDATVVQDERFAIPKVIHYCWFGRGRIPVHYRAWMESWKKFCPDYEIVEWNEDNYDVTKNDYMLQAYEAKRWGFVPDYARLDILYHHGGIYLDTDVEMMQPLDDLLHQEAFAGFEDATGANVALGLGMGAVPLNPLLKEMRDSYEDVLFRKPDGSLNLTPSPYYQTQVLLQHGLKRNGKFQQLPHINLYPKVFFSPKNKYNREVRTNEHSYLLHHFDASWLKGKSKNLWKSLPEIYVQCKKAHARESL